jgi:hypothetical protein
VGCQQVFDFVNQPFQQPRRQRGTDTYEKTQDEQKLLWRQMFFAPNVDASDDII